MADNLKEQTQADFSGGVNAVSTPYQITAKQVQAARNLTLDVHGGLRTRDGYVIVTTGPITDPIVYRGALALNSGAIHPFALTQSSTDGTYRLYGTATSPWTLFNNTSTSSPTWVNTDPLPPQSITVGTRELIARGYLVPIIFDGSSYGQISVQSGQTLPPGAKHVAYFHGFVWLWNTAAATTTLDGPSSLRANDPTTGTLTPISGGGTSQDPTSSWPSSCQTFISRDDGEQGQGLAVYTVADTGISPLEALIAFKDFSTYQITGVFDPSGITSGTINIQKIKSDMGCIAPRSIQFLTGFGVVRLSHKGFALYDGKDDRLISEEIRPYIFGRGVITGINMAAAVRSWAAQGSNPPLYVCAAPVAGTPLTRVFVYDLVRRGWTICDFPETFASVCNYKVPGFSPEIHAGTVTTGRILRVFGGDTSDNGTVVVWSTRTRPFFNGTPSRPSYWRRAVLDAEYTPPQTVTVTPTYNGAVTSATQTLTFNTALSGTNYAYGSGLYGTATYASATTSGDRRSADFLRTAPTVDLTIAGAGNVIIRSVSMQSSPKPLTRLAG